MVKLLKLLEYKLVGNIWEKKYGDYKITVDAKDYTINYGSQIKMDRATTSNLTHQKETAVVFQCVDRLLTLGYKPKSIYLEKSYPSGRREQGQYLDILVLDKFEKPFLMIECKTYSEFNFELAKMEANGGQLFTYYVADSSVKYLCLYTSWFDEKEELNYISNIVDMKDVNNNSKQEAYESWNKTFEKNGVFEIDCLPYQIEFKGLTKSNLKTFSLQDIEIKNGEGTIFNRFAEILRRNSISDKNNAYNKIFNLFLCKIVDEEERDVNEKLWFQWRNCETEEDVLSRLSDLYKRGMEKYLNLDVADYSEQELSELLGDEDLDTNKIFEIFRKLRLYKNNEFAFNEVINERTFKDNAKVVKEVVNLLEDYQIKYSSKHQFLGDFFEKLLNIGVKQESGQFFTPIPIANFIVNSIPFETIINKKISSRNDDFLPYTIDYACGSGHFLTESMHRIDKVLKLSECKLQTLTQKRNYSKWSSNYSWAKEFVYGIELDYRLAKTTKVACYLNGDGDANIIYANGLDSFNSNNYYGRLKKEAKDNETFDVIVANPPYSVADFMKTTPNIKENFSLSEYCTETSDDIELLFIERTYQLLNEGGYCGIILPDTILVNSGTAHKESRKFLLEHFIIHSIVHLGEQTFIKTGQTTVILFMEKRKQVNKRNLLKKSKEIISQAISKNIYDPLLISYVNDVYNEDDVKKFVGTINNMEEEVYKLYIYLLNDQETLICKTGKRQGEIEFLGYKHTDRRNYEGIKAYPENDTNKINSKLYNEDDVFDKTKLSYYIYNKFLDNEIKDEDLMENKFNKNVYKVLLKDVVLFPDNSEEFNYEIITKEEKEIYYDDVIYELKSLDELSNHNIDGGEKAPTSRYFSNDFEKNEIFIRAKHLNNLNGNYIAIQEDNYFGKDFERKIFRKDSIVFPKSGQSVNTNNIAFLPVDCSIVSHLASVYIEDSTTREFVFYVLKHYGTSNLKLTDTGYPTIRISKVRNKRIPIPKERDVLQQIVQELNSIDRNNLSKEVVYRQEQKVLREFKILYIE